jgi:16S rRNA (guanine966-N2)-methyltransferase
MYGEIRIIGGRYKGRKIKVLEDEDLRPTPNRIREAIFNSLQHDLHEASCLDAFAGTGALGIEAISRGAKEVTFVEKNLKIHDQLAKNLNLFAASPTKLVHDDAIHFLQTSSKKFDLIFLDPPFKQGLWESCCELIEKRNLLNPEGIIYLESPYPIEVSFPQWKMLKAKQISGVFYAIYLRN